MMSDAALLLLSAKRSLIGVLLGSAKSIARFRLRHRHAPILGEGLNYSEIEVAVVELHWAFALLPSVSYSVVDGAFAR